MLGEFDSRLNTAALQLQNLQQILNNDKDARSRLKNNGISVDELSNKVPIVVHNVGYMDMILVRG